MLWNKSTRAPVVGADQSGYGLMSSKVIDDLGIALYSDNVSSKF